MSVIEMGKKYKTRNGQMATIISVSRDHPIYPVVAETMAGFSLYTREGACYSGCHRATDLVEVDPWEDFKIDDKVIVSKDNKEYRRYFAGVNEKGEPTCFYDGTTSWSDTGHTPSVWKKCRKAT